jgi:hypothetical protein
MIEKELNYPNRKYMIFNVSELSLIDFNEVSETSIETVRLSFDKTKTFVKWDNDIPKCVTDLITKEGPYSYEEILEIMKSPEWVDPNPIYYINQ